MTRPDTSVVLRYMLHDNPEPAEKAASIANIEMLSS
jgi:hypothetical protein